MSTRENKAHQPKNRPARVPMSAGNKLHVPEGLKKEGFQYYWALDKKGTIQQFEAAYWEKVTNDKGDAITVPAGDGEVHYLMEIEKIYYDEDIAAQQKRNIDATQNQAQTLGEEEYVPLGSKSVVEREIIQHIRLYFDKMTLP